ncbi:MAG: hypothetical protein K0R29_2989 [Pseudobdellovibrio sp.]|jgi:hypothetical protein|nr:hypothetical protein [Pseudobdellovibrio sp.]
MKLNLLFSIIVSLFSFSSFAADDTTNKSETKVSANNRREVSIAPGVNYSEDTGWAYGTSLSYSMPLTERTQAEIGAMFFRYTDSDKFNGKQDLSGVFAGGNFNFGSDYSNNFFTGLGAGYSNILPFRKDAERDDRIIYGYGQFGKRFSLNNDGTFSYKPRLFVYSGGVDKSSAHLDLLNFSYLF